MNQSPQDNPAAAQVEEQAAFWVLRLDRGLTAAEQDEFLQWLTADNRHGAALARHKQNWARLNVLGQWRPEHSLRPNPDLLAPQPRLALARPAWLLPLALAAALLVGLFLWGLRVAQPGAPSGPSPVASIAQRTLEDGSVIELNRGAEVSVLYTPGERRVLYGLGLRDPLTLQEIGVEVGLTRERVRQIECEALDKLRLAVRSQNLRELLV